MDLVQAEAVGPAESDPLNPTPPRLATVTILRPRAPAAEVAYG